MIQKSNIKFTDVATISMKKTSPISSFVLIENQFQNQDSMWGVIFTSHVNTIEHLVQQSNFQ